MTQEIANSAKAGTTAQALPDHGLEAVFAPQPRGYLGADVALSIPLDDERVLWIFGDTLLGEMVHGSRRVDAMPRNSAAIVHKNNPHAQAVQWLGEHPADYFIPPDGKESRWFWPGTGFARGGKVYIIGYEVEQGSGPCESLSFAITGSRMFRISHVDKAPQDWTIDSVAFPSNAPHTFFCSGQSLESGHVYFLGFTRHGGKEVSPVTAAMARIPLNDLDASDPGAQIEVLTGEVGGLQWAPGVHQPHALFSPGVSECSIYHDKPRDRYIATTYDPRDGVMHVTTAPSLDGPWREPVAVYHVPEFRGWERHHAYTFRMHPHLAYSPDEMVFTYVVNTKSLETVLDEMDVYYPRFLRLDLRTI